MRMSRLPRWMHRIWADRLGYFWEPCPLCGRYFGGHEWRDIDGKRAAIPMGMSGTSLAICPSCTRAGRGRQVLG